MLPSFSLIGISLLMTVVMDSLIGISLLMIVVMDSLIGISLLMTVAMDEDEVDEGSIRQQPISTTEG